MFKLLTVMFSVLLVSCGFQVSLEQLIKGNPSLTKPQSVRVTEGNSINPQDINYEPTSSDKDEFGNQLSYKCFYDSDVDNTVEPVNSCDEIENFSLDPVTGKISWSPDYLAYDRSSGEYEFLVQASSKAIFAETIFTIDVDDERVESFLEKLSVIYLPTEDDKSYLVYKSVSTGVTKPGDLSHQAVDSNNIYFVGATSRGEYLVKYNSENGAVQNLFHIPEDWWGASNLTFYKNKLFFAACEYSPSVQTGKVASFDLETRSLSIVHSFNGCSTTPYLSYFFTSDDNLYFTVEPSSHNQNEIYQYDEVSNTARYIIHTPIVSYYNRRFYFGGRRSIVVAGNTAYFKDGNNFYGLNLLTETIVYPSGVSASGHSDFTTIGDDLYFIGRDSGAQVALFKVNGISNTVSLVRNIEAQALTVHNNKLYISLRNIGPDQSELHIYDPDLDTLTFVSNINPRATNARSIDLNIINNTLYFMARDGLISSSTAVMYQLDLSNNMMTRVLNESSEPVINSSFIKVVGDEMVYVSDYRHLTVQNTTTNSFKSLKSPGLASRSDSLSKPIEHNGRIYFTAETITRFYLYEYDPVTKDIRSFPNPSNIEIDRMIGLGDYLYFRGDDPTDSIGHEFYRMNVNTGIISLVQDIYPGSGDSHVDRFAVYDGDLYFEAASTSSGDELWRYDPDTNTANLVQDPDPADNIERPLGFIVYNDELYFVAQNSTVGRELFKYNAATNQITNLTDIIAGSTDSIGSYSLALTYLVQDKIFFLSMTASSGRELHYYDLNLNTTIMVEDFYPGSSNSGISNINVYEDTLFFTANNATTGNELYKYNINNPSIELVKDFNPGSSNSGISGLSIINGVGYFNSYITSREGYFEFDINTGDVTHRVYPFIVQPGAGLQIEETLLIPDAAGRLFVLNLN